MPLNDRYGEAPKMKQALKVLPAEYLAAISVQTGRMKDKLRVQAFLAYDRFDKAAFAEICATHGLACPIEESAT